jgi:ketosteroid isomerase-like protein
MGGNEMTKSPAARNNDWALALLADIQAGKVDGFWEALHPDIVVHEPDHLPFGGTYTGVEALAGVSAEVAKVLDLGTMELINLTADGERVIPLMKFKLVGSGQAMYLMEQWRVEDGKIRELRVFWFGTLPTD